MRTKHRGGRDSRRNDRIVGHIGVVDVVEEEEGNAMAGVTIALAASVPFYLAFLWICFG